MQPTYKELETRVKALRGKRDVRVREVAAVGAPRTLLCVELGDASQPTVAIAAGVHGDEPAGPWALVELLEADALDARFAYRIWPCTNPSGFAAGTRTSADGLDVNRTFGRGGSSPEARAIVTANRDRKFVLSLDLHEDCDSDGFYCYDYDGGALGTAAIAALDAAGLPVQMLSASYDFGSPFPEGAFRFARGICMPNAQIELQALAGMSYTMALARRAAERALTLESPLRLPWETRLAMHRTAVRALIAATAKTTSP
jgi:predicted deacylase